MRRGQILTIPGRSPLGHNPVAPCLASLVAPMNIFSESPSIAGLLSKRFELLTHFATLRSLNRQKRLSLLVILWECRMGFAKRGVN